MKKKNWPFFIYAVAIVVVLALCLGFSYLVKNGINNNRIEAPSSSKPSNTTQTDKENSNSSKEEESNITFSLLTEDSIYMYIGSSLEFTDNFFITNGKLDDIQTEVKSHYNSDVTKINFENKILTATALDSYKLVFTLVAGNKEITKDVTIYVVDTSKITQHKASFKVGEVVSIEDVFLLDASITSYTIETSENLTYTDNKIKFNSAGEGKVKISYVVDGVKYKYTFATYTTEIPRYSILINSEDVNSFETELSREYYSFSYELFDLDGQPSVDQKININIADENIVVVDSKTYPIVSLKLNGVGTTTITITVDDDLNFSKTIQITIK